MAAELLQFLQLMLSLYACIFVFTVLLLCCSWCCSKIHQDKNQRQNDYRFTRTSPYDAEQRKKIKVLWFDPEDGATTRAFKAYFCKQLEDELELINVTSKQEMEDDTTSKIILVCRCPNRSHIKWLKSTVSKLSRADYRRTAVLCLFTGKHVSEICTKQRVKKECSEYAKLGMIIDLQIQTNGCPLESNITKDIIKFVTPRRTTMAFWFDKEMGEATQLFKENISTKLPITLNDVTCLSEIDSDTKAPVIVIFRCDSRLVSGIDKVLKGYDVADYRRTVLVCLYIGRELPTIPTKELVKNVDQYGKLGLIVDLSVEKESFSLNKTESASNSEALEKVQKFVSEI